MSASAVPDEHRVPDAARDTLGVFRCAITMEDVITTVLLGVILQHRFRALPMKQVDDDAVVVVSSRILPGLHIHEP